VLWDELPSTERSRTLHFCPHYTQEADGQPPWAWWVWKKYIRSSIIIPLLAWITEVIAVDP
jgi:hypothetical protein